MTVRLALVADFSCVPHPNDGAVTLDLMVNGGVVGSASSISPAGVFWSGILSIDVHNVALSAGDVVGFGVSGIRNVGDPGWRNFGSNSTYLRVGRGTTTFSDGSTWVGP